MLQVLMPGRHSQGVDLCQAMDTFPLSAARLPRHIPLSWMTSASFVTCLPRSVPFRQVHHAAAKGMADRSWVLCRRVMRLGGPVGAGKNLFVKAYACLSERWEAFEGCAFTASHHLEIVLHC